MNKTILRLAIPNILSNLSVPLLGVVDTALMGRLEDSALYIGAIALGSIIFNFIYWGFGFLRMGTTGITAQHFGAEDGRAAMLTLIRALLVALTGGALLLIFKDVVGEWGFLLIKGSEEVKGLAASYFFIRIYAAPATIASYAFHGWFLGMQNARYPMVLTIVVNVVNVVLNIWFVFGLGMKSDGVALATVLAQYAGILLAIGLFLYSYRDYLKQWDWEGVWQFAPLMHFFQVSKDIFIRTICLVFVFTFFTNESSGVDETILAANSILLQYFYMMSFAVDGFAFAAESLVGRFKGAGNPIGLREAIRLLFVWGMAIAGAFSLVYLTLGRQLIYLFTDNTVLIETALPYMIWMVAVSFIGSYAFVWDGIYIGATATVAMRNMMLLSLACFLLTYAWVYPAWGNHGLWFSMVLFMLSRGLSLNWVARKYIFSSDSGVTK